MALNLKKVSVAAVTILFFAVFLGSMFFVSAFGDIQVNTPGQWMYDFEYRYYAEGYGTYRTQFRRIVECENSDILLAGSPYFSSSEYGADIVVMRVNPLGSVLWVQRHDIESAQFIWDLVQLETNRFLLVGEHGPSWRRETLLFCIDGQGNHVWNRTFGNPGLEVYDAVACPNGDALIAGQISNLSTSWDVWVCRVSATGAFLWNTTCYSSLVRDRVYDVTCCEDGSFVISGSSSGLLVIRLNSNGDSIWNRTYDVDFLGLSITQGATGNLLIAGSQGASCLDLDGNPLWTQEYPSDTPYISYDSAAACDFGYLLVGVMRTQFPDGSYHRFMIATRIDDDGNVIWEWNYPFSSSIDHAMAVTSRNNGFLLFYSNSWINILFRISDPPIPAILVPLLIQAGFVLVTVLLLAISILKWNAPTHHLIHDNLPSDSLSSQIIHDNLPSDSLSSQTQLLSYYRRAQMRNALTHSCLLYLGLLGLWIIRFLFFGPVYTSIDLFPIPYEIAWSLLISPAGFAAIGIGALAFAGVQVYLVRYKIDEYRENIGQLKTKPPRVLRDLLLILVLFTAFVTALQIPFFMPFIMGVALVGFFPQYLFIRRRELAYLQKTDSTSD